MHIPGECPSLTNITISYEIKHSIEHTHQNYSIDKHSKRATYEKSNPILKEIILLQAENQYDIQTKRFDIDSGGSPLDEDGHDGNRKQDI